MLQGAFDMTQVPGTVTPQGIAGFDPLQTGAIAGTAGLMGIDPATGLPTGTGAQYDPAFAAAQQALAAGTSYELLQEFPPWEWPQQYDPTTSNYQDFFNQYSADVTTEALKQMDDEAAKARTGLAGQAQQAGAFGGSRFGVESAELDKNLQDIKSRRIFQDLAQNFEQAQQKAIGTSESARARQLQAAPMFGGLGAQQAKWDKWEPVWHNNNLAWAKRDLDPCSSSERDSKDSNSNYSMNNTEWRKQRQEPYGRLSYFGDVMAGVPSVSQTLTQKPLPYTNPMLGALGMGLGAYGILSGNESGGAFGMFS